MITVQKEMMARILINESYEVRQNKEKSDTEVEKKMKIVMLYLSVLICTFTESSLIIKK